MAPGNARENFLGAFGERARIGRARRQMRHRFAARTHHVARQFDIDRQRQFQRAAQHAGDLGGRGRLVVEHRLVAGEFLEHRELGVDGARLVMQQIAAGAFARARRTGDHHHRRALGIGAGNRVHQVEGAGAVGDDRNTDPAVIARRGVGREADRRLMTEREVRKHIAFLDDLEERQHEIARDTENFPGAVSFQAFEQSGGKRRHATPS